MDFGAIFEKMLASEEAQKFILNVLLGIAAWVGLKIKNFMHAQQERAAAETEKAKKEGEFLRFANVKREFLQALEMGVLSAEQTFKKEIMAKYEDDHKLTPEEGKEIWESVYMTAWNSMKSHDQELLEAGIEDVKAFAKVAIHGNLSKLKMIKLNKQ